MDDFTTLIINRRSIRQFTEQPLLPEQAELILQAALMAPSSKNSRPWQFVAVEEKETLKKLAGCRASGAAFLEGCAMAVVVLGDATVTDAWIEDASIAAVFMQLQAADLGLGSCWCQVRNRQTATGADTAQYVRELLDIPSRFGVLCILGFGQIGQSRSPVNTSDLPWEKVHTGCFTDPESRIKPLLA